MADDTAHGGTGALGKAALYDDDAPHFHLVVDTEHKAKQLPLWSFRFPHMRCFHISWIGFCCSFFSAFAAAPLIEIIRDDLNLRQYQANMAGVVTTAGTVFARVLMGNICDMYGPRYGMSAFLCLAAFFTAAMSLAENAATYIALRMCIGFGLATFVANQFWSSCLFSPSLVGMANAVAGGWGNAGGGLTQIAMPYITFGIAHTHEEFTAWRLAFLVPASAHFLISIIVLVFGQDMPDGNYRALEKKGKKLKARVGRESVTILMNYRMWACGACYAAAFGSELALDNVLSPYFTTVFGWSITKAGNIAAIFGTLNFITRPLGGVLSDVAGKYYGMRGRLWALFFTISVGGMAVSVLGTQRFSSTNTIVLMVIAAFGLEATCGTVYGVVPFVSRRSNGVVCGLVSAGGAIGGVLWQSIFFLRATQAGNVIPVYDSMKWLGTCICVIGVLAVPPLYWPAWGGMFLPAKKGATEEEYYARDFTPEERERGLHLSTSAFAYESRSMRGFFRLRAEGGMGAAPGAQPRLAAGAGDDEKPHKANGAANGGSHGAANGAKV